MSKTQEESIEEFEAIENLFAWPQGQENFNSMIMELATAYVMHDISERNAMDVVSFILGSEGKQILVDLNRRYLTRLAFVTLMLQRMGQKIEIELNEQDAYTNLNNFIWIWQKFKKSPASEKFIVFFNTQGRQERMDYAHLAYKGDIGLSYQGFCDFKESLVRDSSGKLKDKSITTLIKQANGTAQ